MATSTVTGPDQVLGELDQVMATVAADLTHIPSCLWWAAPRLDAALVDRVLAGDVDLVAAALVQVAEVSCHPCPASSTSAAYLSSRDVRRRELVDVLQTLSVSDEATPGDVLVQVARVRAELKSLSEDLRHHPGVDEVRPISLFLDMFVQTWTSQMLSRIPEADVDRELVRVLGVVLRRDQPWSVYETGEAGLSVPVPIRAKVGDPSDLFVCTLRAWWRAAAENVSEAGRAQYVHRVMERFRSEGGVVTDTDIDTVLRAVDICEQRFDVDMSLVLGYAPSLQRGFTGRVRSLYDFAVERWSVQTDIQAEACLLLIPAAAVSVLAPMGLVIVDTDPAQTDVSRLAETFFVLYAETTLSVEEVWAAACACN